LASRVLALQSQGISMIPSREECLRVLKEHHVWDNIIEHCKRVTRNALFIGNKFIENGHPVDLKLLEAAALLHDICKKDEIEIIRKLNLDGPQIIEKIRSIGHGYLGESKMKELGYDELADLVKKHTMQYLLEEPELKRSRDETLILTYADSLDVEGKVNTIENAFKRYYKRYPHFNECLEQEEKEMYKVEKYVLEKAGIIFEDLLKLNE